MSVPRALPDVSLLPINLCFRAYARTSVRETGGIV